MPVGADQAHEMGRHSVAPEQASAFELGPRQKDVIGEWIPAKWPGLSDVVHGEKKWIMGLRWEDIGPDLVLKHRLSKSVLGKQTITESEAGTWKGWDLTAHPMIMEELVRLCDGPPDRAKLPASGPVVIGETTGPAVGCQGVP